MLFIPYGEYEEPKREYAELATPPKGELKLVFARDEGRAVGAATADESAAGRAGTAGVDEEEAVGAAGAVAGSETGVVAAAPARSQGFGGDGMVVKGRVRRRRDREQRR